MTRRGLAHLLIIISLASVAAFLVNEVRREAARKGAQSQTEHPTEADLNYDRSPSLAALSGVIEWNGLFAYDAAGDSIIMKRNLIRDTATHAVKACTAEYERNPLHGWAGAGGGSIIRDESIYYMAIRQKGDDTERGIEWQMWQSTDLRTWQKTWSVVRHEVLNAPLTIQSLEAVSLRKFDSEYYLYVCALNSATQFWYVYYVKSNSIHTLDDALRDGTKWHQVGRWLKDPEVFRFNEKYYMTAQCDTLGMKQPALLESSSPTFLNFRLRGLLGYAYQERHHASWVQPGVLLYDNSSGYFINWGSAMHQVAEGDSVFWFWTISRDLRNWELVDRKLVMDDYDGYCGGTARYISTSRLDDGGIVIAMEWDEDEDSYCDQWVWDYRKVTLSGTGTTHRSLIGNYAYGFTQRRRQSW